MDHYRFAFLTQSLTNVPSRRDVLRSLGAAGLGLGLARLSSVAEAKKKHHHKKRKPKAKPNAFGCLEVGDPCKSEDACCSGICEGKKCRAHGAGTCQQGQDQCTSVNPVLDVCNGTPDCGCFQTTAGSSFCAQGFVPNGSACADCQRDADCEALGFPPRSACAPIAVGNCLGLCESGMACMLPCGATLPED